MLVTYSTGGFGNSQNRPCTQSGALATILCERQALGGEICMRILYGEKEGGHCKYLVLTTLTKAARGLRMEWNRPLTTTTTTTTTYFKQRTKRLKRPHD